MHGRIVKRSPLSGMARRRTLERLQLLCASGAGIEAIATRVTEIACDLTGAASGSIFWLQGEGKDLGYYHDCAPAELKDLFVNRFEELFASPDQFSMISMIESEGPDIGRLITPEGLAYVRASNVYTHLCQPLGHEYALDVRRLLPDGSAFVIALWNPAGKPFRQQHCEALAPMHAALGDVTRSDRARWQSIGGASAHFTVDESGAHLLAISPAGEQLLLQSHLLKQNLPAHGAVNQAPAFARQLAALIRAGQDAKVVVPMVHGRLALEASPARSLPDGERQVHIAIDWQVSRGVIEVDYVSSLPLTLLQKQIALMAIGGAARSDCVSALDVSEEALKKHLRAVFDATGKASWQDLARVDLPLPGLTAFQ
jgi:hypothetical protein